MGKLRVLSGREVLGILREQGFVEQRQRGSHVMMEKTTKTGAVNVPVPLYGTVKIGTLRSIIRQSGLPRELFETP